MQIGQSNLNIYISEKTRRRLAADGVDLSDVAQVLARLAVIDAEDNKAGENALRELEASAASYKNRALNAERFIETAGKWGAFTKWLGGA